jgi:hypothetical protein
MTVKSGPGERAATASHTDEEFGTYPWCHGDYSHIASGVPVSSASRVVARGERVGSMLQT